MVDVVADGADGGQVPVFVAGVAAAHGDDDVGGLDLVAGQRLVDGCQRRRSALIGQGRAARISRIRTRSNAVGVPGSAKWWHPALKGGPVEHESQGRIASADDWRTTRLTVVWFSNTWHIA